ncbi:MAG TPA: IS110 family transposase [Actinomycetota bacterium]
MIFVGIDWAEAHHDACIVDEHGAVLGKQRVPDGVEGIGRLHAMIADHTEEPGQVVIGIEIDRGLLVEALAAAGYEVYAINPMAASRYRDRHATSRAKSDPGDAKVLADLVRTDRHNHRRIAGDSQAAAAIKVLARTHQDLIWSRQRQVNHLRNQLREFYPAAIVAFSSDLAHPDALAVLERAPSPTQGRALSASQIASLLRKGGRRRNIDKRAGEIKDALRTHQLQAPQLVADAYAASVAATVQVIRSMTEQIDRLAAELSQSFRSHPDAEIYLSLPGLGDVLGARALAEFGDDRTRYANPKGRKSYAGTAPITRASGTRLVVLARMARNRRLADACYLWAFAALNASSGCRRCYDTHRSRGKTHHQALRAVANRLVGVLHGCLEHRTLYREDVAWAAQLEAVA